MDPAQRLTGGSVWGELGYPHGFSYWRFSLWGDVVSAQHLMLAVLCVERCNPRTASHAAVVHATYTVFFRVSTYFIFHIFPLVHIVRRIGFYNRGKRAYTGRG